MPKSGALHQIDGDIIGCLFIEEARRERVVVGRRAVAASARLSRRRINFELSNT
jgi:hypothetical protein